MSTAEKIRILLVKRGNISEAELSRRINTTPQNLNSKMKRDSFNEKDLREIAQALNCSYEAKFILNDTGEEL